MQKIREEGQPGDFNRHRVVVNTIHRVPEDTDFFIECKFPPAVRQLEDRKGKRAEPLVSATVTGGGNGRQ
jgi:hypothetical protein